MIIIDLSQVFNLEWYYYLITGFSIGMYLHCDTVRHWIHWLVIKLLSSFIWIMQRTDSKYKPKKLRNITIPDTKPSLPKKGVEMELDELQTILKNNPDISVRSY